MRFLIDNNLPFSLCHLLNSHGHEALHIRSFCREGNTPDPAIIVMYEQEDRIIISRDRDFLDLHLTRGRPARLVHVTAGNAKSSVLVQLFARHLPAMIDMLDHHPAVSVGWSGCQPILYPGQHERP